MPVEAAEIVAAVVIGLGATAIMDLWNVFLKRAVGIPSLDYCMLGRWVLHLPRKFQHVSIAAAAQQPGECAAGWVTHYAIGISLAVGFVLLMSGQWLAAPTLRPALVYGCATVVFPLFVLQPALGLGIASSKAARPAQARLKSMATHLMFGLGIYLCALVLSALPPG